MKSDKAPSTAQVLAQVKDNDISKKINDKKSLKEIVSKPLKKAESSNISTSKTFPPNNNVTSNQNRYKIDINEIIPPPQIAWGALDALTGSLKILGTLGNFSLIIGKAKSKKSFFISMVVAVVLIKTTLQGRLKSGLPKDQNEVLYFDTEQSKYHVQKAVKRICQLINVKKPVNLHSYYLRSLTPSERLNFIEEKIYSNNKIGLVVIDGIKDLVTSINDESEATMIASKLLKWSEERNIHIATVLHQNKGDNNARGHIGTELINKAETVLSVSVTSSDKNISIVEPQQCRNPEPESFAFAVDASELPKIINNYKISSKANNPIKVFNFDNDQKLQLLQEVFGNEKELKYNQLCAKIKLAHENQFEPIGDNKVKELLKSFKIDGLLIQGKKGSPYTLRDPD